MIIRRICLVQEVSSIIEYYEHRNYTLDSKTPISETEVELVFSGSSSSHIGIAAHFDTNVEAFLKFPDGTLSRLYVRRNNWSDE